MDKRNSKETPEVYALRQNGSDWQISRRDFLKAAGFGAAALTAGCTRKAPLSEVCKNIPAHRSVIKGMIGSEDGKYLISMDSGRVIKCWDFQKKSLLGNMQMDFRFYFTGRHDGKSCLFLNSGKNHEEVYCYDLPLKEFTADEAAVEVPNPLVIPEFRAKSTVMDSEENIYATGGGSISLYRKSDDYQHAEVLWEPGTKKGSISDLCLFNEEKSLFVLWEVRDGYGVFDLEKKEMTYYPVNGTSTGFGLHPDNRHVMICIEKSYCLTSLETRSNVWERDAPKPGGGNSYIITDAAVTPDGSSGLLLITYQQRCWLYLISMADGSVLRSYKLGDLVQTQTYGGMVLSRDGKLAAVALAQSILFFSLPELELTGCPMDINNAKDTLKGSEISAVDEITGEKYSYTIPCGAELPPGSVCTCNCVKGRGGCVCNSHSRGGSGSSGSHYWHPN